MVQPEDVAERWKASGVAGMCSGTAEDVAVQRMPRGMLSGPGETLRNVAGWWWKSRQPGDAVRRQAEDGTMVGGGAGDRSGGRRRVAKRKTHRKAEDASRGGRRIGRRKMHRKVEDASEGGRCIGRWKMHRKAEDASGAEAESETERRGIRGFPLQQQPLLTPLCPPLARAPAGVALLPFQPCLRANLAPASAQLPQPVQQLSNGGVRRVRPPKAQRKKTKERTRREKTPPPLSLLPGMESPPQLSKPVGGLVPPMWLMTVRSPLSATKSRRKSK